MLIFLFRLESYVFSDDSSPDLSSDDDASSVKSSEIESGSKTSDHSKGDRDKNDNFNNEMNEDDNEDDNPFLSRKRKTKNSSRLSAMQKRIISDDEDDDSDDDDLELSRISEMVKRKKLAEAVKTGKKEETISVPFNEDDRADVSPKKEKETLKLHSQTDEDQNDSATVEPKSDVDMEDSFERKVSKSQKRKRKLSEKEAETERSVKRKVKTENSSDGERPQQKHRRKSSDTTLTMKKKLKKENRALEESRKKTEEHAEDIKADRTDEFVESSEQKSKEKQPCNKSTKRKEVFKTYDGNSYISDISDAEDDDDKKGDEITSEMFQANIFTNALDKFSKESALQDARESALDIGTVKNKSGSKSKAPLELSKDDDVADVSEKMFAKDEHLASRKSEEKKKKKTILAENRDDSPKKDKKKKPMIRSPDSGQGDVTRPKKKSESSTEDSFPLSQKEQITKERFVNERLSDGTVSGDSTMDGKKKKERKISISGKKETGELGEKRGKLTDHLTKKAENSNKQETEIIKSSELFKDNDLFSPSKKSKKKESKKHDVDVGQIVSNAEKIEGVESKAIKKTRTIDGKSHVESESLFSSKTEEREIAKENKVKSGSSHSLTKSKSLKDKSSGTATVSKHSPGDAEEDRTESRFNDAILSEEKSGNDLISLKDDNSRKLADKEKLKDARKEKAGSSEMKSGTQTESAVKEKYDFDQHSKKVKKEFASKASKLVKAKDIVKDIQRDSKGQSGDGTAKVVESVGKSPEKSNKTLFDKKVQSKAGKEMKQDQGRKDGDGQSKGTEKKGMKEHKKVTSKDGRDGKDAKDSKHDSNKEKDSKHLDGTFKSKEVKETKIISKKEQKTPVKSKEVDLKIWDFGLPSPVKMQKFSKQKEHKKSHSKEIKHKKSSKSAESKESLEKAKKIEPMEEEQGMSGVKLGNAEYKSIEEPTATSKQGMGEQPGSTAVEDEKSQREINDDLKPTEETKDLQKDEMPIKDESPVKDETPVDNLEVEQQFVEEEHANIQGDSSLQLETFGKAAFEASDATSMDSPMTSQKMFETTSESIDAISNVKNESEAMEAEEQSCGDEKAIEDNSTAKIDVDNLNDDLEKDNVTVKSEDIARDEVIEMEEKDEDEAKDDDHEGPLLLDKLSELGAGSDLEDHLGPFHGTKLEETDIDIKELSHPEDTLKMLTQEMSRHEASTEECKYSAHEYPSVRMTGHDFSMLSEEINEKIQRLSSRSFVSELSEEEKHIVNISMEIADDLGQDGEEHVSNLVESDHVMDTRDTAVMGLQGEGDSNEILSGTAQQPLTEVDQDGFHSENQASETTTDKLGSVNNADVPANVSPSSTDNGSASAKEDVDTSSLDPAVEITSPAASRQDVPVTRPSFSRSRTVDLEPRGIAQVVADIDLNSISSCLSRGEKPVIDNVESRVDTNANEGTMNEPLNDNRPTNDSEETGFSEENSRDRIKKKAACISTPTTWRKALFTDYAFSNVSLPEDFKKFAVIKGDYHHRTETGSGNQVRDFTCSQLL